MGESNSGWGCLHPVEQGLKLLDDLEAARAHASKISQNLVVKQDRLLEMGRDLTKAVAAKEPGRQTDCRGAENPTCTRS